MKTTLFLQVSLLCSKIKNTLDQANPTTDSLAIEKNFYRVSIENVGKDTAKCHIYYHVNGEGRYKLISRLASGQTKSRNLPHNATDIEISISTKMKKEGGKP